MPPPLPLAGEGEKRDVPWRIIRMIDTSPKHPDVMQKSKSEKTKTPAIAGVS